MQLLSERLKSVNALTKPATKEQIEYAQKALNITFSKEYQNFLEEFGVISYESNEIFGLGIDNHSYLNLLQITPDLKNYANYPSQAVPLYDIGDGHYYLYDNLNQKILKFALPNAGVYEYIDTQLEQFLLDLLFR
ncbi:MAG: SMI1/KNR4 family protein [Moraxella sp.]|nr:SMI1/KNR4 family protein [Moraxella sp.]